MGQPEAVRDAGGNPEGCDRGGRLGWLISRASVCAVTAPYTAPITAPTQTSARADGKSLGVKLEDVDHAPPHDDERDGDARDQADEADQRPSASAVDVPAQEQPLKPAGKCREHAATEDTKPDAERSLVGADGRDHPEGQSTDGTRGHSRG